MKLVKKIILVFALFLVICIAGFFLLTSTSVSGQSMEPTFHDGDRLFFDFFSTPKIGDKIVFDCLSKCNSTGKLITLAKRLIKIDGNGCYWFEGDNKEHSTDSRKFGWLCPSDINSSRVVLFKF